MKGIGSHLNALDQLKRFAPLIIIIVIGIILLFSLKDDEFPAADVTGDGELVKADEISLDIEIEEQPQEAEAAHETESQVIVDIKGEVKKPGVYELKTDDRIQTVIERAGGFTDDADEQQINLAQKVHDEMVIYVPKIGEIEEPLQLVQQPGGSGTGATGTDSAGDSVRVNSATEDELTTLQGIGPSKAQAIIDYRDEHGPFQQVEDLLEVSGIGEKTLENIREQIIVP